MKFILVGAGSYGSLMSSLLFDEGFTVKGFLDDAENLQRTQINNVQVLGKISEINRYFEDPTIKFIVTMGNSYQREKIISKYEIPLENRFSFKSRSSVITSTAKIGLDSHVLAQSFIGNNVAIGDNVLIDNRVNIAHDANVEDNCLVSNGSNVFGGAILKRSAFISAGAIISNGVQIGENSIVACGSVVLKDVPDNTIVLGWPARVIGKSIPGETIKKFL